MKRARHEWPRQIVEVGATQARKRDPRSDETPDPQATQKISREQLEAVLKGTTSGFRPAARSEPTFQEPEDLADVMRESLRELESAPFESPPEVSSRHESSGHEAIAKEVAVEPPREDVAARGEHAIVTPAVMAPVTFEPLPEIVARATAQQLTPSRLRTRLPLPARIFLLAISALVLSIAIGSLIALVTGPR